MRRLALALLSVSAVLLPIASSSEADNVVHDVGVGAAAVRRQLGTTNVSLPFPPPGPRRPPSPPSPPALSYQESVVTALFGRVAAVLTAAKYRIPSTIEFGYDGASSWYLYGIPATASSWRNDTIAAVFAFVTLQAPLTTRPAAAASWLVRAQLNISSTAVLAGVATTNVQWLLETITGGLSLADLGGVVPAGSAELQVTANRTTGALKQVELMFDVALFGGDCTATELVVSLDPADAATDFTARLEVTCALAGISGATVEVSSVGGAVTALVTSDLSFLDGLFTITELRLATDTQITYLAGSGTGSVAGFPCSVLLNTSTAAKTGGATMSRQTAVRLGLTGVSLGTLVSKLFPSAAGSLPDFFPSGFVFPSMQIYTPDMSLGMLALTASVSGVSARLVLDRSGILMADIGLPGSLSVNDVLSRAALPTLPYDVASIMTITAPYFKYTSARANASLLSVVSAASGFSAPPLSGTYMSLSVALPRVAPGSVLPCVFKLRDALGAALSSFAFQITSTIPMMGGLFNLTGVSLSVQAQGLQASASANFQGISMAAAVSLPKGGAAPSVRLSAANLKLGLIVWAVWDDASPGVIKRLANITFVTFDFQSYGNDSSSRYYGRATGPRGEELAVAVDRSAGGGLRYLALDMGSACYSLHDLADAVALSVDAPLGWSLCAASVRYVPRVAGSNSFALPNGTVLSPVMAAGFKVAIPELSLSSVSASFSMTGNSTTLPITVTGNVSLFDGACTATSLRLLVDTSASDYSATLVLTCPDLQIFDLAATLSYSNGDITVDLTGNVEFVDGAITVTQLSLSTNTKADYVAGLGSGTLAGYDCSVSFNRSLVFNKTSNQTTSRTEFSVGLPSDVRLGPLISSLISLVPGSGSVTLPDYFPSDFKFPSIKIYSPDLSAAIRGAIGSTTSFTRGTSFGFGLKLPSLAPSTTLPCNFLLRNAAGSLLSAFQFAITQDVPMLNGLFNLSGLSLATLPTGLQAACSANLLGLAMSANVSLPKTGGFPNITLRTSNVNLGSLVSNARIWGDVPDVVVQKLQKVTFPAFTFIGTQGLYFAQAGPLTNGLVLSFGVDTHGSLRYFRFEQGDGCLTLADVISGMRLDLPVPSNSLTLCGAFFEYIPTPKNGSSNYTLPNGTVVKPSTSAGFSLSVPELSINNVTASITLSNMAATTIPIVIFGSIPLFGGACTATRLQLNVNTATQKIAASLTLTCPDLQITNVVASLTYTAGNILVDVVTDVQLLDGAVTITDLRMSTNVRGDYLAASGAGSAMGQACSVAMNLTKVFNATSNRTTRRTLLSTTLPSANLGKLVSGLLSKFGGSGSSITVPDFFPSDYTFPSLRLYTPDLSSRVFGVVTSNGSSSGSSSGGLFADLVFDRSGLLTGNVGIPDGLNVGTLVSKLGLSLPFDTSSLLSISKPSFSTSSPRANASFISSIRGTVGSSPSLFKLGTSFGFGLKLPSLAPSTTLPCNFLLRNAAGSLLSAFQFAITQDVPMLNGLFNLSGLSLATLPTGLQAACSANLLGLAMSANVSLPKTGGFPNITLRTSNVNLGSLVSNARIWGDVPDVVVQKLQKVTFPAFTFIGTQGLYFAQAGPLTNGLSLSFGVDRTGSLRYFRFDQGDGCLTLDDVISGMRLDLPVPSNSFTLCGAFFEYIPTPKAGSSNYTLPNGTVVKPATSAGFSLSVPELSINNVTASITVGSMNATTIPIVVSGSVPLFGGACTATRLQLLVNTATRNISASMTLTCPDLQITNVVASLTYTAGNILVDVVTDVQLLDGAVTITDLRMSTNVRGDYLATSGAGSAMGQACSVAMNLTKVFNATSNRTTRRTLLSTTLPSANLGKLVSGLLSKFGGSGSSITVPDFFPSSYTFPSLRLYTPDLSSRVFGVVTSNGSSSGSSSGDLFADLVFDRSGLLTGNVGIPDGLNVGTLVSKLGLSLPFDTSSLLSISKPSFSTSSPRANASFISSIRGTVGSSPSLFKLGTSFGFGLKLPSLAPSTTLPCNFLLRNAAGSLLSAFQFAITQDVPMLNGLFNLSGLSLATLPTGLQAACSANLLGLAMSANVSLPKTGGFPNITLRTSNVNLGSLVSNARIWGDVPDVVVQKLQKVTFPAFTFIGTQGQYFAQAGPLTNGLALSFGVDNNGSLRYFRFEQGDGCLTLADVISGMRLDLPVPSNSFTLCGAFFEYIPTPKNGSSNYTLHNGTVVKPATSAGFSLSVPELSINNVTASITVGSMNATTIPIVVSGSVPLFGGACTATRLQLLVNTATRNISASMTLTCPDLQITNVVASLTYTAGNILVDVVTDVQLLDGAVTITDLRMSTNVRGDYLAASGAGSAMGQACSVAMNLTKVFNATSNRTTRRTLLSTTLPSANLGKLVSGLLSKFGGSGSSITVPDFFPSSYTFPSLRLYTPDLSSRVFGVVTSNGSSSGSSSGDLFADLVFDRSGLLTGNVGIPDGLNVGTLVSKLGLSLPFDTSSLLSISKPSFSTSSPRANASFISSIRGTVGSSPSLFKLGTSFGFGLKLPSLAPSTTLPCNFLLRNAAGSLLSAFQFAITQDVPMLNGLFNLSGLSLATLPTGLQAACSANLLGLAMSANVSLPKTGGFPNITLRTSNVNLGSLVSNARIWGDVPDVVVQKLQKVTFPAFTFIGTQGQYFAQAGPLTNGLALSFGVDNNGSLRYFRFEQGDGCLTLADVISGMRLDLPVPSNSFTLCGAFFEYIPTPKNGSSNYTLPNGTVVKPATSAGFSLSVPELSINNVTASITVGSMNATTIPIVVSGSVPLFGGACTATRLQLLVNTATRNISASMTLTCPDLQITNVVASLTYTAGNILVDVVTDVQLLDGAVTITDLRMSTNVRGDYLAASGAGSAMGQACSVAMNLTKVFNATSNRTTRRTLLSTTLPSANLGKLVSGLLSKFGGSGSSITVPDFFPSSYTFPSLRLYTPDLSSRVFGVVTSNGSSSGSSSGGLFADLVFDRSGLLTGNVGIPDGLNVGTLVSKLGLSLPFDTSSLLSISKPSFSTSSPRANASFISSIRGTVGSSPSLFKLGTSFGFGLKLPSLAPSTTLPCNFLLRNAAGSLLSAFQFAITQDVPMLNGLFNLSGLSLATLPTGLQAACSANLLGLAMSANVSLPKTGGFPNITLRTSNVNLGSLVSNARIWGDVPDVVVQKLQKVTFPAFTFIGTQGQYFAQAGPLTNGLALSFGVDNNGSLRYFRFEQGDGCLTLADVISGMRLDLPVPSNSFTLCGAFFEYIPTPKNGSSNYTLPNGTVVKPATSAGFSLSVPELSINNVTASITVGSMNATTIPIVVSGSVPLFGGACTATRLQLLVNTATRNISASMTLTCPDLQITNVVASLTYTAGNILVDVVTDVQLLDGAVTITDLRMSTNVRGDYLAASGAGSAMGQACSVAMNLTKVFNATSNRTTRRTLLSTTLPSANLGKLVSGLLSKFGGSGSSITVPDFFPSSYTFPSLRLYTPDLSSRVFGVLSNGSLSGSGGGVFADLVFDRSGLLSGSVGIPGGIKIESLLSKLGLSLPFDTSSLLSIGTPLFSTTSPRANGSLASIVQRTYFAEAGPVNGVSLALAIDGKGLRYIRLDTGSQCLGIGEILSGMGLSGQVQVPDVFTLCNPFLEVVPRINGA
ncbi:hypothetical protein HYH03_018817 [Edaphochlamys debaryana]|uniref:Uncharacterized protein n=1 Tax=Edaphochlamys debaryana TaxID=47281 RepID=A0A836BP40_9CHLO|nr:hypothetical protein HYH03_018817 [Edaphochlamys debaryana]|eukprot:KAG2482233.1 hypothetical protein HYH03_018817 [Edaphochlamys debaryana]